MPASAATTTAVLPSGVIATPWAPAPTGIGVPAVPAERSTGVTVPAVGFVTNAVAPPGVIATASESAPTGIGVPADFAAVSSGVRDGPVAT